MVSEMIRDRPAYYSKAYGMIKNILKYQVSDGSGDEAEAETQGEC